LRYFKLILFFYFFLKRLGRDCSKTFKYIDFCFGKDKNHIFYYDTKLPLDVNRYSLNNDGFIYDNTTIFHFQNQITLDSKSFEVLGQKRTKNLFSPTYILQDKNGKYEYNRNWKNEIIKMIS